MKKLRQFLRYLFPGFREALFACLVGLSLGLTVYLGLLQRHFFSWRYLAYALLIAAAGIIFAAWLNQRFIQPLFKQLPKPARAFALLAALLLNLALFFNTELQPLYYILPDSELKVSFTVPELPEGQEGVALLWIKTGQGFVHYTNMEIDGRWERQGDNLLFAPGQSVTLTWAGKVGPKAEVVFYQTAYDQPVRVAWNGVEKTYNLNNPRQPNIFIRENFNLPFLQLLPFSLAFLVAAGYGLLAALLLLAAWQPGKQHEAFREKDALAAVYAAHAARLGRRAAGLLAGHRQQ